MITLPYNIAHKKNVTVASVFTRVILNISFTRGLVDNNQDNSSREQSGFSPAD
jgi:hypothetical protein